MNNSEKSLKDLLSALDAFCDRVMEKGEPMLPEVIVLSIETLMERYGKA